MEDVLCSFWICSVYKSLSAHRSHIFELMPFLRPISGQPIVIIYLNILLLHRLDYLHYSARQNFEPTWWLSWCFCITFIVHRNWHIFGFILKGYEPGKLQNLGVVAIVTNCALLVCLYDDAGRWKIEPGLAAILMLEHLLLLAKFGFSWFVPEVRTPSLTNILYPNLFLNKKISFFSNKYDKCLGV